jgi:hypothetical protein
MVHMPRLQRACLDPTWRCRRFVSASKASERTIADRPQKRGRRLRGFIMVSSFVAAAVAASLAAPADPIGMS